MALHRIVDKKGAEEIQNLPDADAFTILSILLALSLGAPQPLLEAGELRNHICPGLVHGYMIANLMREMYPLDERKSKTFISISKWLKDTPSKRFSILRLAREIFTSWLSRRDKRKI